MSAPPHFVQVHGSGSRCEGAAAGGPTARSWNVNRASIRSGCSHFPLEGRASQLHVLKKREIRALVLAGIIPKASE